MESVDGPSEHQLLGLKRLAALGVGSLKCEKNILRSTDWLDKLSKLGLMSMGYRNFQMGKKSEEIAVRRRGRVGVEKVS
ncbi:unnamed protein product [Arctia plantaginis]|uniref:Uncharacterized protein n=1 Tax=Arctia plantaginis TaxID=874455 RepID=A0A8S0YMS3_ARCPL|nr:unnamed protein product [Arctia plantaginis]